jgi:Fe-S cluster assembly protein SufD
MSTDAPATFDEGTGAAVATPPSGAVTPGASVRGHSHGAPVNPVDARKDVVRSFDPADFAQLTGREEEWRFTPLARLRGLHNDRFTPATQPVTQRVADLPEGVAVRRIGMDDQRVGSVLTPFDRVSARAHAAAADALLVSVARNATPAEPVIVDVVGGGAEGASFAHTVIELGESAEATVVLDHSGAAQLADNVEILVGANARLRLVTIADWSGDSVQLQHQKARLGRDAGLTHIAVSLGGDLVRQYTSVEFADRGAEVDAYGIYFADAGQHLEHRLLVDHAVPDCRSYVAYRGALQGQDAHTVWVGDVAIRAAATGTDTYEVNRNLILSDGARADSIPNLEIETGEVAGAGHASATGRFDDEQLFYLQSRGITAEDARRLVVRGFFAELLAKIGVPAVSERLATAIEARLAKAGV